jgi:hypothetical protein
LWWPAVIIKDGNQEGRRDAIAAEAKDAHVYTGRETPSRARLPFVELNATANRGSGLERLIAYPLVTTPAP